MHLALKSLYFVPAAATAVYSYIQMAKDFKMETIGKPANNFVQFSADTLFKVGVYSVLIPIWAFCIGATWPIVVSSSLLNMLQKHLKALPPSPK
jgi:hypothetical protein